MKKICFIGFGLFTIGGCQRVTISLANNLCQEYETHLLSLCEVPSNHGYYVNNKVKVHSFGMPLDMRARKSLTLVPKLIKFLREKDIDILFIAGSLPIPLVSLVKPFVKTKVIFCDHENLAGRDKKSVLFRKLACKISDKVVVLTRQTLWDYKEQIGIPDNKIAQMYNSIECIPEERSDVTAKKIISVGRISAEKGFDMAVEVAEIVFAKHKDWKWDIYGDGPDFEKIKSKINEKNLQNQLFLKGADAKVRSKYKDYSICVLPSYREGFAVVLLEAKISGLPVVSFDCNAGPNEIINDGVDGYLIPCYNIEVMVAKICDLIENYELRKSFSEHSCDNIDKFSQEVILRKWCEIIDKT